MQRTETIAAAELGAALSAPRLVEQTPYIVISDGYKKHSLESFMRQRTRARGSMATDSLDSFEDYVVAHQEQGAAVFVTAADMRATAVLNLGTPEAPGHADNTAHYQPTRAAAYTALLRVADGYGKKQGEIAEFLEDWPDHIVCFNSGEGITPPQAIAAIRKITIEALRKVESAEQQLSASKTSFESVTASSANPLPTHIYFACTPYADLQPRTFVLRLGIQTGGDKPSIFLRIVNADKHQEQMAQELVANVQASLGEHVPVLIGSYSPGQ
ncbi:MAG: DUF2303 family protein [Burkholderiaceae bacterium]